MRQWFYQSCTEYGFWQNASQDNSRRVRSVQINADYHNELCHRLFQMNGVRDVSYVTKKYYEPLLSVQTSQIFFTTGLLDPWRFTGISIENKNAMNPNTPAFTISDGSHCSDLYRGGSSSVTEAKTKFQNFAKNWLQISIQ